MADDGWEGEDDSPVNRSRNASIHHESEVAESMIDVTMLPDVSRTLHHKLDAFIHYPWKVDTVHDDIGGLVPPDLLPDLSSSSPRPPTKSPASNTGDASSPASPTRTDKMVESGAECDMPISSLDQSQGDSSNANSSKSNTVQVKPSEASATPSEEAPEVRC